MASKDQDDVVEVCWLIYIVYILLFFSILLTETS